MAKLLPDPRDDNRARLASQVRTTASSHAERKAAVEPPAINNGEPETAPYAASFTKGLVHDQFGLLSDPLDFDNFKIEISQQYDPDHPSTQFPDTPFPDRAPNFRSGSVTYPATGWDVYPAGMPARFLVKHPAPAAMPNRPDLAPHAYEIPNLPDGRPVRWRSWESPLAGHTFDLEGPDSDAVAAPPAPRLGSEETAAEMAELYAMALLRDLPFDDIGTAGSPSHGPLSGATPSGVLAALNTMRWFQKGDAINGLSARARRRRKARFQRGDNELTPDTIFRGSVKGAEVGPYVSQFLLIGSKPRSGQVPAAAHPIAAGVNPTRAFSQLSVELAPAFALPAADDVAGGFIQYGVQFISQRFVPHKPGVDYLSDWGTWIDVQNGADRRGLDLYEQLPAGSFGRFPHTPRQLATWVHFDALYQAYLNACLLLIGMKASGDRGLPEGAGHPTRAGFATFGDPHILSLVTEVATRALKAVRRSKYQIHLRARPEAAAGLATLAGDARNKGALGPQETAATTLFDTLPADIKNWIAAHNANNNQHNTFTDGILGAGQGQRAADKHAASWVGDSAGGNLLLPVAFPEGSPMHPSYGAGHATVAGACVTVLKAFFEMYDLSTGYAFDRGLTPLSEIIARFEDDARYLSLYPNEFRMTDDLDPNDAAPSPILGTYRSVRDGDAVETRQDAAGRPIDEGLTIQGELNKLAANIAIARNMAGVHYYSDYFESLRLGERVAVGVLQEQILTYREPVSMRFRSFDGDFVLLTGNGGSVGFDDARIHIRKDNGQSTHWTHWWRRAADEA